MFPLLTALLLAAAPAARLDDVLRSTPADSLAAPLRRLEQEQGRSIDAGEVAFVLGQFHFARGEYRQAAETFARAAARLAPARKPEARYWQGLAQLALKQPTEARATLEEVAQSSAARRADALLGLSFAWELASRPDRALDAITPLVGSPEAGPALLERAVTLASALGRADVARRAEDRLRREWPQSVEAARLAPAGARAGHPVRVRLGAFSDLERARSLVEAARAAGFPAAQTIERRQGASRLWIVQLGSWPNRADAERAGRRASEKLGVPYRLEDAR